MTSGKPVEADGNGGDASITKQVQAAAIGADPQFSGERFHLVLMERGDDIGGKTVARGESGDVSIQQMAEAAAGADPEGAGVRMVKRESADQVAS